MWTEGSETEGCVRRKGVRRGEGGDGGRRGRDGGEEKERQGGKEDDGGKGEVERRE